MPGGCSLWLCISSAALLHQRGAAISSTVCQRAALIIAILACTASVPDSQLAVAFVCAFAAACVKESAADCWLSRLQGTYYSETSSPSTFFCAGNGLDSGYPGLPTVALNGVDMTDASCGQCVVIQGTGTLSTPQHFLHKSHCGCLCMLPLVLAARLVSQLHTDRMSCTAH